MVTKYQKFGDGYKAEAVKLYRESNQTIAETARNLSGRRNRRWLTGSRKTRIMRRSRWVRRR